MRFLYIALAAALMGPPAVTVHAADEECLDAATGTLCADDGDPCTFDECDGSACTHFDVPSRGTCEPLVDAYRRTLGLGELVVELRGQFVDVSLPATARLLVENALDAAAVDLTRASDALAGRIAVPPPAAGETIARARARAAFGITRVTPPRVRGVVKVLAVRGVRGSEGSDVLLLARRTRFLYRSTNQLKRELRRLQRVTGVFAR